MENKMTEEEKEMLMSKKADDRLQEKLKQNYIHELEDISEYHYFFSLNDNTIHLDGRYTIKELKLFIETAMEIKEEYGRS